MWIKRTGRPDWVLTKRSSTCCNCTVGSSITLAMYPEGADSGDTYWTGTATIETWGKKVELNGIITISMAFTGNGALTGPATV